ncbi:MAG: hypothetical protein Q7T20_05120 [Saprospiraceae bacterium]|nr:hypothetical protein [Saprospiraceae bacterium]
MSFTRQRSSAGQQASDARSRYWLSLGSESVINWSPVSICFSAVGSRCRQYGLPGFGDQDSHCGSNPSDSTPAQIHIRMKIARKAAGVPASDKSRVNGPEDQTLCNNQVFAEKPAPRQPESPDVESLRSLLKANMTREKASPALLQRIRSRMFENKD